MRSLLVACLLAASASPSVAEPALRAEYGRSGDLEVGAAAGGMFANDLRIASVSVSVGWFVADGVALSSIVGVANIGAGDRERTSMTALVEPAVVPKIAPGIHGLVGLGVGAAYVGQLGAGAAIAPRIGAKLHVGRSGVVTPSVSFEHVFNNVEDERMNPALDATLSSLRFTIGYSAFW